MKFLAHDIQDKNFLRYIKRFLIAGIMEGTERIDSDRGTPQGRQISPVLANVYLHYVLDLWFEKAVKPKLRGEAYYVRYADDFLILFQYENEARAVKEEILVSRYLRSKKGFILVSHDRAFLDGCVDHILSIYKANIEVCRGNFSNWYENKQRQDAFELSENEKLKREIRRLEGTAREKAAWSDRAEGQFLPINYCVPHLLR